MNEPSAIATFYSAWAPEYANTFATELEDKPADREWLARLDDSAPPGPIIDIGCGPGHIGAWVQARGGRVVSGIDIAPGMIELAREQYPQITFQVGNFASLPCADHAAAGAVAFYSLIHAPPGTLPAVCAEILRCLVPGGLLLAAFHEGRGHMDKDGIVFHFVTSAEVSAALEHAGFTDVDLQTRPSYSSEGGEHPRLYVMARRPLNPVDQFLP